MLRVSSRVTALALGAQKKMQTMEVSSPNPPRPWRVIAHELTHEMDPKKVMQLSAELNRALAQEAVAKVVSQQRKIA
jgi:predicted P-loop ATPase/GTPase